MAPKKLSVKFRKAPEAPKRFRCAYILFSAEKYKEIKARLNRPNEKTKATDIAKLVSEEWKNLPSEERKIWEDKAERDKARYEAEILLYKGDWRRPANKRSKKDPSSPKRPMSAFLAFSNSRRTALKLEHPKATNSEISRMLSKLWDEAPDEVKRQYTDEESRQRIKYEHNMGEWRKEEAKKKKAERDKREAAALDFADMQQRKLEEKDALVAHRNASAASGEKRKMTGSVSGALGNKSVDLQLTASPSYVEAGGVARATDTFSNSNQMPVHEPVGKTPASSEVSSGDQESATASSPGDSGDRATATSSRLETGGSIAPLANSFSNSSTTENQLVNLDNPSTSASTQIPAGEQGNASASLPMSTSASTQITAGEQGNASASLPMVGNAINFQSSASPNHAETERVTPAVSSFPNSGGAGYQLLSHQSVAHINPSDPPRVNLFVLQPSSQSQQDQNFIQQMQHGQQLLLAQQVQQQSPFPGGMLCVYGRPHNQVTQVAQNITQVQQVLQGHQAQNHVQQAQYHARQAQLHVRQAQLFQQVPQIQVVQQIQQVHPLPQFFFESANRAA